MTKDEIIEILEENKGLIENKEFDKFYNQIRFDDKHYFTDLFLKSGINPLDYMKEVPPEFAYPLENLKIIKIPNSIQKISRAAFARSGISSIIFEDNSKLDYIGPYAFTECINLTKIWLPKSIYHIDTHSFYNCHGLKDIYYEGSIDDWNTILNNKHLHMPADVKIHFNSKQ